MPQRNAVIPGRSLLLVTARRASQKYLEELDFSDELEFDLDSDSDDDSTEKKKEE